MSAFISESPSSVEKSPAASSKAFPPLTVEELKQRAARLLPELAAGASERERHRELPHAQIRRLAAEQLLTFRIPAKYGGADASVPEVIGFIIDVASFDSNIAQALRPSFAFLEGLRRSEVEADREKWFPRYLAGHVFGNAGWEIGGANGEVRARIVREGDHFRVNGSKYYSTGSLYADWIGTMALDEEDKPVGFTLPPDREGLELLDDFDAMGQRLTASGTIHLNNVIVHADEVRPRGDSAQEKRTPGTPFLQLYLGAVLAGIAKNALSDAVDFANHHARPIKHSTAAKSVDDPYVQFSVGEIGARAYAAEAVILKAAATLDEAWKNPDDPAFVTRARIEVAQAQFLAAESALKAAELIFDVGGASTTARKHNLDRHWRNARTVANHNPRHWKAAVAGAWHLSGTEPPPSGLF